jgi:hypothetical protein
MLKKSSSNNVIVEIIIVQVHERLKDEAGKGNGGNSLFMNDYPYILLVPTFCLLCLAPKVDSNLAWHPSNQSIVLLLLSLECVCVWRIALTRF